MKSPTTVKQSEVQHSIFFLSIIISNFNYLLMCCYFFHLQLLLVILAFTPPLLMVVFFFLNVKTQRVFPILFTASSHWIDNGCHILTILVERLLLQFPILIKQYRLNIIKTQNQYFTIMWTHY